MLHFQPMQPSMGSALQPILQELADPGCEFSAANLYLWGPQRVAVEDGFVYVLTRHSGADSYLLPAGSGDLAQAVRRLAVDAQKRHIPLNMYAVTDRAKALLEEAFPGVFSFHEVRSGADYIYDIHRLAELKGKKLQAKRNHIHRFADACPGCQTVTMTVENLPQVQAMVKQWYAQHEQMNPGTDYRREKQALAAAFTHFDALHMEGLMLVYDGRVIAMTMGNQIRRDVFDVNFEKAFPDIPGAYAAVNQAFASRLRQLHPELRYLNREDDMGLEGLRKAKLSYHPDTLLRKWVCVASPEQVL